VIAAALALALAAAPARNPPAFGFEVSRASPRHPTLVLAPRPGDRAVLVVRFDAGVVDDGEAPGTTRLAQHALVVANRRSSHAQLVRDLFEGDATLTMETGLREASFVLEADARSFPRLAATLLEQLLAPSIDPQLLQRARDRALNDERESTGRKDLVARHAPKAIDDWRYQSPPYGDRQSLENLSIGDVRRHLAGPLSPSNATIVAAGAFDPRPLRAAAARLAGGAHAQVPRPRLSTPFSMQIPALREVYLVAFPAAFDTAERTAAARLATALLTERIHEAFRDRGIGYAEAVLAEHRPWIDLFMVLLPAHAPSEHRLAALLEEEIAAVREGRFDDAALERNRAWALAELEQADRDPEALARILAEDPRPRWYGREVAARLRALDRTAVTGHLRALLEDRTAIRVLYSPRANARGAIPESYLGRRTTP
jgi:predicted Zn-dependent peptidase